MQLQSMADVYRQQGRYPLARATARQAYARAVAAHKTKDLAYTQLLLAQVYDKLGQPNSAFALAQPSFAQAQQQGDKFILQETSGLLATL